MTKEETMRLFSRARIALTETGVAGVARRSSRVALKWLATRIESAERNLFYAEAQHRLPQEEHEAGIRTGARIRGCHRGTAAFVVGTGPSVGEIDLARLAKWPTFGVNSLFLHRSFDSWSPTWYCLMDDHFFEASQAQEEFSRKARSRIGEHTQFIVPAKHIRAVHAHQFPPSARTWFVPMDGALNERPGTEIRPEELVPYPSNSVLFALTMAILSGASPIVLLGTEHSWLTEMPGEDPARPHFHRERLKITAPNSVKAAWNPFDTYLRTMRYCTLVWESYEVLLQAAIRNGQEVVNATPNSFLDIFPRVQLERILDEIQHGPAPTKWRTR